MKPKLSFRNYLYGFFILLYVATQLFANPNNDHFYQKQKKYPRFRQAVLEKENSLKKLLKTVNLDIQSFHIYIRVFKQDKLVELWIKHIIHPKYQLLKTYPICALSGSLGPKRQQGDFQIPEGFYFINYFNPSSSFYLSLKINYPNASDRFFGKKSNLGGDIYIHGDCVTIGCIPITNNNIKELYLAAVLAIFNGQKKIPVHIFPIRLNKKNVTLLTERYQNNQSSLILFWQNIKKGYDFFETNYQLPKISINRNTGYYQFEFKNHKIN